MQTASLNKSTQVDLEKLPSIPHSLLKLLEAVRDPDASFTEITKIIQTDPALTSRFLSIANSGAHYQFSQYSNFNTLIVSLGLKTVKNIACHAAVQQFFSQFNVDDSNILAHFWEISLSTASIAKSLAHVTGYTNEDEAYFAGLLHKLGELVCLVHDKDNYTKQLNELLSDASRKSLQDKEEQKNSMEYAFIGATIPELGASLIHEFDKKSLLGDAVLFQREAAANLLGAPHLVQLINLSHKLSMLIEHDDSTRQAPLYNDEIYHAAATLFNLNQPLLEDLLSDNHAEVLNTAKNMGLNISDNKTISIDEKTQIKLADEVRTIAMSGSLQHEEVVDSRSEQQLIEQIMQNLNILFGLSNCLFLAYDEQSGLLEAQYSSHIDAELLSQFKIPLEAANTLAVRALLKKIPVLSGNNSSSDKSLPTTSVVDKQLTRLLSSDDILCIPLLDFNSSHPSASAEKKESRIYGILVAGVSAAHRQKVKREKGLLYEFSKASSSLLGHERKRSQQIQDIVNENLQQQQELQSLHIRKLVHEANNPLGVIRNYLQILSHKLEDSEDEKLPGQLEILMSEVERVGQIVLRIRETPKSTSSDNNQVDINELLSDVSSIFKESLFLKAGITISFNLDTSLPPIESNSNSIKQIITNLFKNAAEAMPDGGNITITTRDKATYKGKQFIELCISDNGPGIPEEVLKNNFKPLKTTKTGEHSGLGLSIIKNLVNDLGGMISAHNNPLDSTMGGGAEFIIRLPRKLCSQLIVSRAFKKT